MQLQTNDNYLFPTIPKTLDPSITNIDQHELDILNQNLLKNDHQLRKVETTKNQRNTTSRKDAEELHKWFIDMIQKVKAQKNQDSMIQFEQLQLILMGCMSEVTRQVSLQCQVRGSILQEIWNYQISIFQEILRDREQKFEDMQQDNLNEVTRLHKLYKADITQNKEKIQNQEFNKNLYYNNYIMHEQRAGILASKIKIFEKIQEQRKEEIIELKKNIQTMRNDNKQMFLALKSDLKDNQRKRLIEECLKNSEKSIYDAQEEYLEQDEIPELAQIDNMIDIINKQKNKIKKDLDEINPNQNQGYDQDDKQEQLLKEIGTSTSDLILVDDKECCIIPESQDVNLQVDMMPIKKQHFWCQYPEEDQDLYEQFQNYDQQQLSETSEKIFEFNDQNSHEFLQSLNRYIQSQPDCGFQGELQSNQIKEFFDSLYNKIKELQQIIEDNNITIPNLNKQLYISNDKILTLNLEKQEQQLTNQYSQEITQINLNNDKIPLDKFLEDILKDIQNVVNQDQQDIPAEIECMERMRQIIIENTQDPTQQAQISNSIDSFFKLQIVVKLQLREKNKLQKNNSLDSDLENKYKEEIKQLIIIIEDLQNQLKTHVEKIYLLQEYKVYYDDLEQICKQNISLISSVDFKAGTVKNLKHNTKQTQKSMEQIINTIKKNEEDQIKRAQKSYNEKMLNIQQNQHLPLDENIEKLSLGKQNQASSIDTNMEKISIIKTPYLAQIAPENIQSGKFIAPPPESTKFKNFKFNNLQRKDRSTSLNTEFAFQLLQRILEKKQMKQCQKSVSLPNLIKFIQSCYMDKLKFHQNLKDPLYVIAYDNLQKKFGLKKQVEQKLMQLMESLFFYMDNLKIKLFASFLKLSDQPLEAEDFDFFIQCIQFLEKQMKFSVQNLASENQKCLVTIVDSIIESFFVEHKNTEFINDFKKQIQTISQGDEILIDNLLFLIVKLYNKIKCKVRTDLENIFFAADLNKNESIELDEFLTLFRNIEQKNFNTNNCITMFIQNADILMSENQKALSLNKFASIALNNNLFSKNKLKQFAENVSKHDYIQNIQQLRMNWNKKITEIKEKLLKCDLYSENFIKIMEQQELILLQNDPQQNEMIWISYRLLDEECRRQILDFNINLCLPDYFNIISQKYNEIIRDELLEIG